MKILSKETRYKSIGDGNERPLRAKFVKVLSEKTRYKSTRDENERPLKAKSVKIIDNMYAKDKIKHIPFSYL